MFCTRLMTLQHSDIRNLRWHHRVRKMKGWWHQKHFPNLRFWLQSLAVWSRIKIWPTYICIWGTLTNVPAQKKRTKSYWVSKTISLDLGLASSSLTISQPEWQLVSGWWRLENHCVRLRVLSMPFNKGAQKSKRSRLTVTWVHIYFWLLLITVNLQLWGTTLHNHRYNMKRQPCDVVIHSNTG